MTRKTIVTPAKAVIVNAVQGIYALGAQATVLKYANCTQYEYGKYAEQDYRIVMSALNAVYSSIVSLQLVTEMDMIPLADRPSSTSRAGNKEAMPDNEQDIERAEALDDAITMAGVLIQRLKTLEKIAKDAKEQAGKKDEDGSQSVFDMSIDYRREFKGYAQDFSEYVKDKLAGLRTKLIGTRYHVKLQKAKDVVIPTIGATQADDVCLRIFSQAEVKYSSQKAWIKLVERFAKFGEAHVKYEKAQAAYNLIAKPTDAQSSLFARECEDYNDARYDSAYWCIERGFEAHEMLSAAGVPSWLILTPLWRAKAAEDSAVETMAQVQEVMAKKMEIEALTMKTEANIQLVQAQRMTMAANEKMAAMQAKFDAMFKEPVAPKAEEPKAEEPTQPIKPAAIGLRIPRSISGKGAAGFTPR